MTPARLLEAALAAGDKALRLLADPAADMAEVTALAEQRGEWLAAAQAALPAVPAAERAAVAACLVTLAVQQADLADQLAGRHEDTMANLSRMVAVAGRVRHRQVVGTARTSGQRLDFRL